MAEQAIIESRHVAPDDQEDDSRVIQLISPLCDGGRVVAQRVEGRTHAEAKKGAAEEAGEDDDVRIRGRPIAGRNDKVQEDTADGKGQGAQQVRPDVNGLVVQGGESGKRDAVAVARRAVPAPDKGIVSPPTR